MSERLLTARDVGHLLGFSPSTIVDWAEAGKVPCFKVGGRLRFRKSEVQAWLETKRAGTGGEAPATPQRPPGGSIRDASNPEIGGEDALCSARLRLQEAVRHLGLPLPRRERPPP